LKTGVLGGTFDPVHNGHISVAEEVKAELGLDEVIFIPTGQPWLKVDWEVSAAEHRLQMVHLAIAGKHGFSVSSIEVERPGPSYSVDTISELLGQLGEQSDIFFILGWDSLSQLPMWHRPAKLVELCRLVAVPRPGYSRPDLDSLDASLPGLSHRVIFLDKPKIDISASNIRSRVAQGLPIGHLVPEPVEEYIKQRRLYALH
jgi:nicotinate-nucleotide adenylyltransferase